MDNGSIKQTTIGIYLNLVKIYAASEVIKNIKSYVELDIYILARLYSLRINTEDTSWQNKMNIYMNNQ